MTYHDIFGESLHLCPTGTRSILILTIVERGSSIICRSKTIPITDSETLLELRNRYRFRPSSAISLPALSACLQIVCSQNLPHFAGQLKFAGKLQQ